MLNRSELTKRERKKYIAAVKCLGKLEAKTPLSVAPGVRRRYDDFVATHINQTFSVHNTGNFLGWHRFLTWTYEQTLRNECGYDGYQPYYNWPKWAADPASSPALDGSDTSMSGNGELGCTEQQGYGIPTNDQPNILIPHGEGGGCLKDGPFKDFGMNLGPVFGGLTCTPPNPFSNFSDPAQLPYLGLGYNPRCLKRDISPWTSSQWTNDKQVVDLLECKSIYCFWANMQGGVPAFVNNFMGVHTAGHFTIGGDPGSDFVASNGDPWFYLHHAQIDRVWWMWQNQQPHSRTNAIYGTITLADTPPSRNA
jgi:tyrosinase